MSGNIRHRKLMSSALRPHPPVFHGEKYLLITLKQGTQSFSYEEKNKKELHSKQRKGWTKMDTKSKCLHWTDEYLKKKVAQGEVLCLYDAWRNVFQLIFHPSNHYAGTN